MSVVSLERLRDTARAAFWVLPSICVLIAIGLGVGLLALDDYLGAARVFFLFPGPPEGARSLLSAIIQAMIAFTGLVFSITVVVLQLTSSQFSPRVLRSFLVDRTIQLALGIFVATFVYAMVVLRGVRGALGFDPFVPRVAVTAAFGFVLLSVAMFMRYISHVADMIRLASIVSSIGRDAGRLLERRHPTDAAPSSPPVLPPVHKTVTAPIGGVLVSINETGLVRNAARTGCVLEVVVRVGQFVPTGAPLVRVRTSAPDADDARLPAGRVLADLALDKERTLEQDLGFAFRQLVDIAEKALSPSVNDPTTATQAIDVLHDLLRRLAARHLAAPMCRRDRDGVVRLVVPQLDFAGFLDLAVSEIWRYGSHDGQIPDRLRTMLVDLATVALPEHRHGIEAWSRRLRLTPDAPKAAGDEAGGDDAGRGPLGAGPARRGTG